MSERSTPRDDIPTESRSGSRPVLTRRRLLQGILAASAVAAIPACGQETTGGTAASPTATGAQTAAEPKTVSIFNWVTGSPDLPLAQAFERIQDQASNELENISLEYSAAPLGEYITAVSTRAQAGNLTDVVGLLSGLNHEPLFPTVEDLSSADVEAQMDRLRYWSSAARPGGGYFGIPLGTQGIVFYYNRALYEEAGLDPETPPETWDEFASACNQLRSAGIEPLGASGLDAQLAWHTWMGWCPQFMPESEDVTKIATGEVSIDDPRILGALQATRDTYTNGWWQEGWEDKEMSDVQADFISGRVATVAGLMTGVLDWATFDEQMGSDSYGVFAMPTVPGSSASARVLYAGGTFILGINRDTDVPEATMRAIEFLTSKAAQEALLDLGGMFPNLTEPVNVGEVTGSQSASMLYELLTTLETNTIPQVFFRAEPKNTARQNLIQAITNDDLESYLANLAELQEQA